MGKMLNLVVRLTVIILVAALLLAGTNALTKDIIEERAVAASQGAQRAVLTAAERFEVKTIGDYGISGGDYGQINGIYEGYVGDELVGYVFTAAPTGYGGPLPITLGVGVDGAIHRVEVGELQESAGLGSRVGEEPYLSQYRGLAADPDVVENKVDVIAGVTKTTAPFKEAVRQMVAFSRDVLGVEPKAAVPALAGDDLQRQQQLAAAQQFEQLNTLALMGDFDTITSVRRGMDNDNTVGYSFELASKGFVDLIKLRMAIDSQGVITGMTILENPETEGYGHRLSTEPAFIDSFAGTPAAQADIEALDGLSGATVSSKAVKKAAVQAANFYNTFLSAKPDIADTWEDVALPTPDQYKAVKTAQKGIKGGQVVCYRFGVQVTGYHEESPIQLQVDVDAQGNYLSLTALEQKETPGIGAEVFANETFLAQFIAAPAALETADAVQAVSGATVTSDALVRAIKQVARAYQSLEAAPTSAPTAEETAVAPAFPVTQGPWAGAAFEPVTFADGDKAFPTVKAIDKATQDGQLVGYRIITISTGFNEDDKITLEHFIDAQGSFAQLGVLSHGETPGFGATILDDAAALAKVNGVAADDNAGNAIDAKSGVTLTVDAVKKAVKQAALAYQSLEGATAPAAEAPAPEVEKAGDIPAFPVTQGPWAGATFEPVTFADTDKAFPTVKAIDKATQDGQVTGYRIVTVSTGFNENDKITLEHFIDAQGSFAQLEVLSHGETPGFGATILDDAAALAKVNGVAADDNAGNAIDAKSGVTLTVDAVKKAVKQAALAYQAIKEVQ